jgi:hypothetical protein
VAGISITDSATARVRRDIPIAPAGLLVTARMHIELLTGSRWGVTLMASPHGRFIVEDSDGELARYDATEIRRETTHKPAGNDPATQPQIDYLRRLTTNAPDHQRAMSARILRGLSHLTRDQASSAISQLKAGNR